MRILLILPFISRYRAALALALLLALGACSSEPKREEAAMPPPIPVGQSTDLSGARIDQARAVAMGLARSRGWSVDSSNPDRLVLIREIRPGAYMVRWPKVARPRLIEVQVHLISPSRLMEASGATGLRPRLQGTRVILQAFLVGADAEGKPVREELTQDYENEITISLSALQSAWLESKDKILSDVPVPEAVALPPPSSTGTTPERIPPSATAR